MTAIERVTRNGHRRQLTDRPLQTRQRDDAVRSGPEAGARDRLRPCPQAPAGIRRIVAELSDRRKGRAPQSFGETRRRTLGRSEGRVVGFGHLALSRPEAPSAIIEAASAAGVLRKGPTGSAWFAHYGAGSIAHVDVRGPTYKGSLTGGAKSLFHLPPSARSFPRLVLAEAAIDALSVAAVEGLRADTLYAASGGGHGAGHGRRARGLLAEMATLPALSYAAPRTPTDRAIASQTATDRSQKNSTCRSRGFGLQSKAATGMTCFAPAHNMKDRHHDS
jgi:hypothetical protein